MKVPITDTDTFYNYITEGKVDELLQFQVGASSGQEFRRARKLNENMHAGLRTVVGHLGEGSIQVDIDQFKNIMTPTWALIRRQGCSETGFVSSKVIHSFGGLVGKNDHTRELANYVSLALVNHCNMQKHQGYHGVWDSTTTHKVLCELPPTFAWLKTHIPTQGVTCKHVMALKIMGYENGASL